MSDRPFLVASMTTLADLARLCAERPGLRLELVVKAGLAGGTLYRITTGDGELVEVWSLPAAVNHALALHDEAGERQRRETTAKLTEDKAS